MDNTFTVTDDIGMGYESGTRVLQSLGNWPSDLPANVPRPNLIPFIEPYIEGGSMHPASRLKALQQVQHAAQTTRKTTKCNFFYRGQLADAPIAPILMLHNYLLLL